jgi:type I restriction enzyme R subunit
MPSSSSVPYIFLANGHEIRFWEWQREAFPRLVKTFFSPGRPGAPGRHAQRASATRSKFPSTSASPGATTRRLHRQRCARRSSQGRRKLLVEMATGTGKTRTAAAFIKRLFEANAVTRVLFLVDRIPLAKQTEDAFAEHLTDYPAYVLRAGRRFEDEKRITITTLQSMVNIYSDYSAGYFDLVITTNATAASTASGAAC